MASVRNFEELIAWQRAPELTREVYRVTRSADFARDFGLSDQIRRAAVSIMSNLAEGSERGSAAEFNRFLFMAKGSCAEGRSQLYIALDAGYLTHEEFASLQSVAEEVGRLVGGLRAAVGRQLSK